MKTVKFTEDQFKLVSRIIFDHYHAMSDSYQNCSETDTNVAYGAIISMRLPEAEQSWKEYQQKYPDPDWRAYTDKEQFFKDLFCIYPSDMKARKRA